MSARNSTGFEVVERAAGVEHHRPQLAHPVVGHRQGLSVGSALALVLGLLNAVVLFGQARRPVVILDEIDNIALWILAILTNFTAMQRIWHVRQQLRTGPAPEVVL